MTKKIIVTSVVLVATLGIAFFSYSAYKNRTANEDTNHIDLVDDFNNNLDESTDDSAVEDSDTISENNSTTNETSNGSSSSPTQEQSTKKDVGVILTRAEQTGQEVVVEGFAQTLRQEGTCTVSVRHNGTNQTVTGSTKTSAQPSYVNCNALYLPIDKFKTEGTWVAQITYSNPQETGASNQIEFEVEL